MADDRFQEVITVRMAGGMEGKNPGRIQGAISICFLENNDSELKAHLRKWWLESGFSQCHLTSCLTMVSDSRSARSLARWEVGTAVSGSCWKSKRRWIASILSGPPLKQLRWLRG